MFKKIYYLIAGFLVAAVISLAWLTNADPNGSVGYSVLSMICGGLSLALPTVWKEESGIGIAGIGVSACGLFSNIIMVGYFYTLLG